MRPKKFWINQQAAKLVNETHRMHDPDGKGGTWQIKTTKKRESLIMMQKNLNKFYICIDKSLIRVQQATTCRTTCWVTYAGQRRPKACDRWVQHLSVSLVCAIHLLKSLSFLMYASCPEGLHSLCLGDTDSWISDEILPTERPTNV